MPDSDPTLFPSDHGRRPVRTAVLTGAAALGLILGGAGALALDDGDAPTRWAAYTFAQTEPGGAGQRCPERDGAEATLLRFAAQDTAAQTEPASDLSVADVAERVNPAVVTITILSGDLGAQAVPVGAGSGFIVDTEGHVVTNNHVVAGASRVTVELLDGSRVPAQVLATDPANDLAVLKADIPADKLAVARLGDSDAVTPGEPVVAIGSPFGFEHTITAGIVSAVDRQFGGARGRGPLQGLIQTDAAINPGNSGGPLFNAAGEVIGVNTMGISGARGGQGSVGVSFAVPVNAAKALLAQVRGS